MNPQQAVPGSQFVDYAANRNSNLPPLNHNASEKSHKGLKVLLAIVAVITTIVAGTSLAAYAFMLTPAVAIPDAINKINLANQIHVDVALSLTSPLTKSGISATLNISSDIDRSKAVPEFDVSAELGYPPSFNGSGELKFVNRTYYAKVLNPLSLPLPLGTTTIDMAKRWVSVSMDALMKYASSTPYTKDYMAKIQQRYSINDIYSNLEKIGVLKISFAGVGTDAGVNVRKYEASIDKDALAQYLVSLYSSGTTTSAYSSEYVSRSFTAVTFSPIIVTTDLWSGSLRSISGDISYGSGAMPATSSDAKPILTTLHFAASYSEGLKEAIVAPKDAYNLDYYIMKSADDAKNNAIDAKVMSDLYQMRTRAEMSYDSNHPSYLGVCKTVEMATIKKDITDSGATVVCHDSVQAYSMTASIHPTSSSPDTKFYCIDSTGYSARLKSVPTGISCK